MSDWEFLLQKEGDQTWLPLESADVEILEGRYRIVANTYIANTEVQIRIIHDSTEETPPVRRVHKRSSRTRSQGLVSIIPFTRLNPGFWEFRCLAKLSTSSKEAKQHIVHLQVLPTEYDSSDFSQQLEPQNQELYTVADSQPELKELMSDGNASFFSGQADINQVNINQGEDRVKKSPEFLKLEAIKSEEIELLNGYIQDESKVLYEESETVENITNFLDSDDRKSDDQEKQNTKIQNQQFNDIDNQLKELTDTLINNSLMLGQIQPEVELELNQETETDTKSKANSTVNFPLELILDEASYIAKPGVGLIISGQITIDNQNQSLQSNEGFDNLPLENQNNLIKKDSVIADNNTPIVNGNLKICLRNPQTSGILIEVQQTLPEQVAPIIFACTVNVPENIKTNLILGEIILTDHRNTLANKSFTITAPLENWLAAIDDNFVEDEHQEIVSPQTSFAGIKPEQKLNSFQELVEKINQSKLEQKIDKEQFLPTQICESVTGESGSKSLKLPTFGNPLPEDVAKEAAQINDLLPKSNAPTDPDEADDVWQDSEWSEGQTSLQFGVESDSETVDQGEVPENMADLVPFPTKFALGNKDFKELKLEDRFFSKAHSLMNDSELLQWMKASSLPSIEETDKGTELENISESKQKTEIEELEDNDSISLMVNDEEFASVNDDEINWEAQEFVIEDEELEEILPNQEKQWNFGLGNISQEQEQSISRQSYILPDEQPLPVPHIEVLAKVVMAGRSVKVRVKLPEGLPRIYVKIWVYDRQARAVVAGPRWLTDFVPNGMGEIEVITELDIVYGCLEVRFEAIAAEVQTNRESHKAVIEYSVVPPPPPELPFDYLS